MQTTKILYTANEGQVNGGRVLRWLDGIAWGAMMLVIGSVFWGVMASDPPAAQGFVRVAVWGMACSLGVLGLLLSINKFGPWGWAALVPLGWIGVFWLAGDAGQMFLAYWGNLLGQGGRQMLEFGLYGLGGLAGLGLLARLIEKVGGWGLLGTLLVAVGAAWGAL